MANKNVKLGQTLGFASHMQTALQIHAMYLYAYFVHYTIYLYCSTLQYSTYI